jgi:hypothetical protein
MKHIIIIGALILAAGPVLAVEQVNYKSAEKYVGDDALDLSTGMPCGVVVSATRPFPRRFSLGTSLQRKRALNVAALARATVRLKPHPKLTATGRASGAPGLSRGVHRF